VVGALPMKLVLADDDLGLVPLAAEPGGEPGAVLLHRSGLFPRWMPCSSRCGSTPIRWS
jgi:hypothetical protein